MATTQNPDGSWNYSGPVLTDPIAQAAVEASERAAILGNEVNIGQQVDAALAGNSAYLAVASPSNAQVAAQVKKLTQQQNGIIRLLRRKLDATT